MEDAQAVAHPVPGPVEVALERRLIAGAVDRKAFVDLLTVDDDATFAGSGEEELAEDEQHRGVEEGQAFAAHGGGGVDLLGDDLAGEGEFVDRVDDEFEEQIVQARAHEVDVGDERGPQLRALGPGEVGSLEEFEQHSAGPFTEGSGVPVPQGTGVGLGEFARRGGPTGGGGDVVGGAGGLAHRVMPSVK